MSEKRCYGCMLIKQNSPFCEHCGHDERKPNAPHQLPPGTLLNNQYIVGKVLGQGGFGITYMGWDQFLGIPVAIKEFYPSGLVTRDTIRSTAVFLISENMSHQYVSNRERFVREATSLARLGRSRGAANIVRVQNLVQANSTAYIIMEYVDGIDMRQYMRQKGGILTLEQTLRLLLPLMESLEKVHESHIVHRDISPDNIMVLPDGSTKLIDFGAAHEVHQDEDGIQKSTEAILKYGFAPPEQYQRKGDLGPWTDVYALCATIYYCTTGQLPPSATDRLLGSEEFHWEEIPGITSGMIQAMKQGTAINKDTRIQTMAQLRQSLTAGIDAGDNGKEEHLHMPVSRHTAKPFSAQDQRTIPLDSNNPSTSGSVYTTPADQMQRPVYTAPVKEHDAAAYAEPMGMSNASAYTAPIAESTISIHTVPVQEPTAPTYNSSLPKTSVRANHALRKNSAKLYGILAVAVILLAASLILFRRPENTENTAFSQPHITTPAPTAASTVAPTVAPPTVASTIPAPDPQAWRKNVLMHTYDGLEQKNLFQYEGMTVYSSNIANNQILSVTFLDTLADEPSGSWDVSASRNGTVKAWVTPNAEQYDLYIAAEGGINGRDACRSMFAGFTNLQTVNFGDALHTEEACDMYTMFAYCKSLTRLDLSKLDTSSVTDMGHMFDTCIELTDLNLSHFDTANVASMRCMFYLSGLTALDLRSFDTGNVTDMCGMFSSCYDLTSLDLREWDTSCVTNMGTMFAFCYSLAKLDIHHFDTARVANMIGMFANCINLTELDISGFDTSNVTDMSKMFVTTNHLKEISMPKIQTEQVLAGKAERFMDDEDTINGRPWKSYFTPEQYTAD